MIYITLVAGVVLAPFMVIGGWARRRSRDFGPFFVYAGLLFAFSAIVSAVHVPGGTFIHSAIALAPFSYILALEGVAVAVAWVARRRSVVGRRRTASRIFTGAVVGFAVVVRRRGSLVGPRRLGRIVARRGGGRRDDADRGRRRRRGPRHVDRRRRRRSTGRTTAGVVLVNDPIDTIERGRARLRHRAGSSSMREESVPAAAPILAGEPAGWVGPPLSTGIAGPDGLPAGARLVTRREAVLTAAAGCSSWRWSPAIVVASVIVFPKPEDTAYYVGVARNLVEGRGLVTDALWSFATPDLVIPHPAFEVWLPLPTFLAAIPMAILGTTFQAAQVSSVLIGRARAGPGLAARVRTSPRNAACRPAGRGPWPSASG